MTATEVARNFSEALNRVAAGEEIEVMRNGAMVAVIGPAKVRLMSAARFRVLMESLPPADADFAQDLREIRRSVGPREDPWRS
jgi:prevent-host-death family protein